MDATTWTLVRSISRAGGWEAAASDPVVGPDAATAERLLNEGLLPPRFAVRARLGAGGDGAVYRVHDGTLDREVAVKLVRGDHAAAGREVRLAARFDHPHLLPVHDGGRCGDGWHWFAMRLSSGRPLDTLLDGPQLGIAARVRLLVPVCDALAHAHRRGICHHDVKPGNILVDEHGGVLLADWGSATTAAERAAGTAPPSGTPAYMPPEQARQTVCDERSDVWSLGATLFHLLVGRPPLGGCAATEFWQAKRDGRIDPPTRAERRAIPRALLAIALRALTADPAGRYASVGDLRDDLVRWLDGQAVSVLREGPLARLRRWCGRNPRAAQGYAAAGLALAIAVGWGIRIVALQQRSWQVVLDGVPERLERETWNQTWFLRWQRGSGVVVPTDDPASPWRIEDGALVGTLLGGAGGCCDLTWRLPQGRDLRFTARITPQTTGGNVNLVLGRTRYEGVTLHLGGWGDPTSAVLTGGAALTPLASTSLPSPLRAGTAATLGVELVADRLTVRLDGEHLFDQVQIDRLLLARLRWAGFEVAGNRLHIDALRCERLGQPGLVDAIGIGDVLAESDHHREAIAHWRALMAHGGQDAAELWMRISASQAALGNQTAAEEAWRHVVRVGDAGQQTQALLARFRLAVERGDLDADPPPDVRELDPGVRSGLLWTIDRIAWRRFDLDRAALLEPEALDQALERHLSLVASWADRLGIDLARMPWLHLPPGLRDGADTACDGLRWQLLESRYAAVQPGLITDLLRWQGRANEAHPHPISSWPAWIRILIATGRGPEAVARLNVGTWNDGLRRDPQIVAAFAAAGQPMPEPQPTIPASRPQGASEAIAGEVAPRIDRWTDRVRAMHRIVDALDDGHGLGALVRVAEMRHGAPTLAGGLEMDPCFPAIVHACLGDADGARALLALDAVRQPARYRPRDQRRLADLAQGRPIDDVVAGLGGPEASCDDQLDPALLRGLAASLAGDQLAAYGQYRRIRDPRLHGLAVWSRFLVWVGAMAARR